MKKFVLTLMILLMSSVGWGAINLNGDADLLDCGDDVSVNVGSGDFSVGLWFNRASELTDQETMLIKGAFHIGGKRYWILIDNASSDNVIFSIDDNSSAKQVSGTVTNMDDGAWHHVLGVRDGNNLRMYIDGVEDAASPTDITGYGNLDQAFSLKIGAGYNNNSSAIEGWFTGKLSEVYIWKGVALSATEAALLGSSKVKRIGLQIQSSNLSFYSPLDEGSEGDALSTTSNFYKDISGNANHCTGTDANGNSTNTAETVLTYP